MSPRTPGSIVPVLVVVEDYEDTRRLYVDALRAAGFVVEEADNGEDAVALALSRRPAIVFMDLSMPGVDGWDAAKRIRQADPRPDLFLIAVSAAHGPESRQLAFESGFDDFVAKPCLPETLVSVAHAFLSGRKPPRS